ncbi:1-acyl-sn-glycerol-3-phosphate acyltransferase [Lacrimispora xylanisolvens]|uniref:1-acyl-sn-glycerol-3-phosphate acyltransferase n=1 Tax=Lacrimispora xylanisolvens TaxID=384636 RepID=A0A2S6HG00_9FIRM|nr:lysophospholipid acyltransferase family protein [Hungatella xylanolytica]MBE5987837.1 1-acyl-sn-glycerol-3-phosphate acyltransferase [Paenibacillaceae bacterium]PPK76313.1 1-acyl-sn-glycerol-3-phosphate acyltransferase [Hungatella xylanolytica]
MNRIFYMVVRNFLRVPLWYYKIRKMGIKEEYYPHKERYEYIRNVVKKVNKSGRVEVMVHGVENIPSENGFILFPNHQGLFDMLAIMEACPKPLSVVVKKEAANLILVKEVVKALDGFYIDRQDIKASLDIISRMTAEVKEKKNFVIFAEGTRSREGNQLLPFKGGTFKSAVNACCPIVPVALIDSFKPFDENSSRKQKVEVCFLKPLYYEDYQKLKTTQIAELVHDKIQEEINQKMG